MTNKLINETSPYLLQHKDNPVSWYSWNTETLSYAKNQKLPILLSIGYSSCHWCHVMAHESFENNKIASIMNSNFINIKVDREERPDIDSLYQAYLSVMGQQGGWPLTMFLDNKLIPFWGGTYFPSIRKHGLPSFTDVLGHIKNIYINNKHQVIHNTSAISESLKKIYGRPSLTDYSVNDIEELTILINQSFENKDNISITTTGPINEAVEETLDKLDKGILRVCEKINGEWKVNQWVKKAILLSFLLNKNEIVKGPYASWFDKIPGKTAIACAVPIIMAFVKLISFSFDLTKYVYINNVAVIISMLPTNIRFPLKRLSSSSFKNRPTNTTGIIDNNSLVIY